MAPTQRNLKQFLDTAEEQLTRGESVKVAFDDQLHSQYLDYKLSGYYADLMCMKQNGDFYLARVR